MEQATHQIHQTNSGTDVLSARVYVSEVREGHELRRARHYAMGRIFEAHEDRTQKRLEDPRSVANVGAVANSEKITRPPQRSGPSPLPFSTRRFLGEETFDA